MPDNDRSLEDWRVVAESALDELELVYEFVGNLASEDRRFFNAHRAIESATHSTKRFLRDYRAALRAIESDEPALETHVTGSGEVLTVDDSRRRKLAALPVRELPCQNCGKPRETASNVCRNCGGNPNYGAAIPRPRR